MSTVTKLTGYISGSFPVLVAYICLNTSSAFSCSLRVNRYFGLSGKKNRNTATSTLGIEQIAKNILHELYKNIGDLKPMSRGMIIHANATK